jgi:hypothetical protein
VDGKPREILKAEVVFRAVSVPPGNTWYALHFIPLQGHSPRLPRSSAASLARTRDHKLLQKVDLLSRHPLRLSSAEVFVQSSIPAISCARPSNAQDMWLLGHHFDGRQRYV